MVICRQAGLAEALRVRSLHGLSRDAWQRYSAQAKTSDYEALYPGYKYNMMDVQASLGLHQLAVIERHWLRRQAIWQRYDAALAGFDGVRTPAPIEPGCRHAYHLYTLQLDRQAGRDRDALAQALRQRGIGTGIHFKPVHLHRWYRETLGHRRGEFPAAEAIGDGTLSLPLSPALTDEQVERVIAAVTDQLRRPGR